MSDLNVFSTLSFQPVFRDYLWGGRRLETVLGKSIPAGPTFAESWEVVDHGSDQSLVAVGWVNGDCLAGWSLCKLVETYGNDLLGPTWFQKVTAAEIPSHLKGRFPLLIKWLDAQKDLSIQVHPNDLQAALLDPPDLGKTEAWYIADAVPGSKVYAGLKDGTTEGELKAALQQNRVLDVMHCFKPNAGDCLFIPAGTVHALGAGLLVAEVQQCSNTTYRLYDWDRLNPDGRPRALHIQASLEATNYQAGPVNSQETSASNYQIHCDLASGLTSRSLVTCQYFLIDEIDLSADSILPINQCQILICLSGKATISCSNNSQNVAKGSTVVVPYSCSQVTIKPSQPTRFLVARLP